MSIACAIESQDPLAGTEKTERVRNPSAVASLLLNQGPVADRREKRFQLTEPTIGVIRSFLDVVVQKAEPDEWVAVTHEALVVGETLAIDVVLADVDRSQKRDRFPVHVIDSQPVIVGGDVRHRIRLRAGDITPIFFDQPAMQVS
jgi:hypothetical protein